MRATDDRVRLTERHTLFREVVGDIGCERIVGGRSTLHTLPVPEIDERGVLIAVHTSGVAGWDVNMRQGWSPTGRTKFPFVLGTCPAIRGSR